MSPYRTAPKPPDKPPVLCPRCGNAVTHEWLYVGSTRELVKAWCKCGWRLTKD